MLTTRLKRALVVTATAMFVLAAVTFASSVDESIVDATAPTGSVTLAAGASGAIAINLSVTGKQDGTATFDVYRDWTLSGGVFAGSNPQTFTVPARAAQDDPTTFSANGTVTAAAGQADGIFTLAVGAFGITNINTTGAKLSVGNSSAYSITVETPTPSDTTAPIISYVLNPASPDGSNGWYKSDVTLTWTVTEDESPSSLVKTGCVDQNITVDQQETTYSCSATSDGGSATQVDVKIKRDATAPTVALVGGPADGASYYFGSVPAAPTCSASDATSGLQGACSVSGYSPAVGPHTITASATDNAGNTGSDSHTYTVLAWTLYGFYQPVDVHGVWNTVKGGSTVPFKFEIFVDSTELTNPADVSGFSAAPITCPSGSVTTDPIEVTATGATALRYDSIAGQFVYNWQTPKKPGNCYQVTMTTADGSSAVGVLPPEVKTLTLRRGRRDRDGPAVFLLSRPTLQVL